MLNQRIEPDGIAIISWNQTVATSSAAVFFKFLGETLATCIQDTNIRGIIFINEGPYFLVGPKAAELYSLNSHEQVLSWYSDIQKILRMLETNSKPVVAVIAGNAIGIGYELALACHYRVMVDIPNLQIGLNATPWLPVFCAGATQRLPRMIGLKRALPYLLERKKITASLALQEGLVDTVVSPDSYLSTAKKWILDTKDIQKPWDKKGFNLPGGGIQISQNLQLLSSVNALVHQKTLGNYPSEHYTLSALYEGLQVEFDQGLILEGQFFAKAICSKAVRHATRTLSILKDAAKNLEKKPAVELSLSFKRVGVIGSGMMGSGIALVLAKSNIEVLLIDQTREQAEKGKAYTARKLPELQATECLKRITTSDTLEDLKNCDLVIEAVTEHRATKAAIFKKLETIVAKDIVIASNTSTLPITSLAQYLKYPDRFIGLHFFSPVERMELLEMIQGQATSTACIAAAFDFAKQIQKVPILVQDGRGFYTSRVFQTYLLEGFRMLEEGIRPALIENSGKLAGFPVGPLAVADEVGIDLIWHILKQTEEDLREQYQSTLADTVVTKMVGEIKRPGRKGGGGFYEYPKEGPKYLWQELAAHFSPATKQPSTEEVQHRLLCIQTLEAYRCLEEHIVSSPEDADLGSVLGWGFPAFTGGVISYIDYVGLPKFTEITGDLKNKHGERFLYLRKS